MIAGWSSPVARQAHNLKVIGSNPIPATNISAEVFYFSAFFVSKNTCFNTSVAIAGKKRCAWVL